MIVKSMRASLRNTATDRQHHRCGRWRQPQAANRRRRAGGVGCSWARVPPARCSADTTRQLACARAWEGESAAGAATPTASQRAAGVLGLACDCRRDHGQLPATSTGPLPLVSPARVPLLRSGTPCGAQINCWRQARRKIAAQRLSLGSLHRRSAAVTAVRAHAAGHTPVPLQPALGHWRMPRWHKLKGPFRASAPRLHQE